MIKIIGLTGPSGSGKTTLCNIASQLGIRSIDTDKVYHELLSPPSDCLLELTLEFGQEILDDTGNLNRAALASIVFAPDNSGTEKLDRLNKISHKYVLDKAREIIREAEFEGEKMIIVDAPALYESGFDKECDAVVCVLADKATRLDRIVKRDVISVSRASERLNGQKDDEFYSARADFTIINNGNTEMMKKAFEQIITNIEIAH
jgi:dephospho-CoA kinase